MPGAQIGQQNCSINTVSISQKDRSDPLTHMPISNPSNSAANKDIMS